MQIKGSVAVVTGGASGLGEATVRKFISLGGRAAILDLAGEAGKKLAEDIGRDVIFINTDVTDEDSVRKAVEKTVDAFGAIHVLANCAGVVSAKRVLGRKGVHSLSDFNRVIQVNLVGTFNVIRLAAEKMAGNITNEEMERGVIVNTASVAAFEGPVGQAAYSASKGGVVSMTLPLARELAEYGIRVATIAPGLFTTPMLGDVPDSALELLGKTVPFPKRSGRPPEFAQLVCCIVENTMLNGAVIRLDGAVRINL